jgi:hypothetical protein
VHVFDVTASPARQVASIKLTPTWPTPGWITTSIDGKFFYPSSGDVIERASRKLVASLGQEQVECMVEVDFKNGDVIAVGKQFGIGRPEFSGKKAAGIVKGDYDAQKQAQLDAKLIGAAGTGTPEQLQKIIASGANPNASDSSARSALMTAAAKNKPESVLALIEAGATIECDFESWTALKSAAEAGNVPAAGTLIDKGARVDWTGPQVSYRSIKGGSPLQVAAANGRVEMMNFLLEKKADINRLTQNNDTALMLAAEAGKTEAVDLLLKKGADPARMNLQKKTALALAQEKLALIENPPPVEPGKKPEVDPALKPNYEAAIALLGKK